MLFEEEYKKSLIEINEMLKFTYDENIRKQLLKDKQYIENLLFKNKFDFKYNNQLDDKDIFDLIMYNQGYYKTLRNLKFIFSDNKIILDLFNKFIVKNEFKLKNTYKTILNYNGIKYINLKNANCFGSTIYIQSLNKNYIQIYKTKKAYECYSTLIHELGHSKINFCANNEYQSSYTETYPIFLELVFSDFLKDNGAPKESFNIKSVILNQVKEFIEELYEEYNDYVYYNENQLFNKYMFENKFKSLKGYLLALELYFNYQTNPQDILDKLEVFVNNIRKINDNDLLRLIDIEDINSNKNINKFYELLKDEKVKIKKIK